jgi:hypothetical protein
MMQTRDWRQGNQWIADLLVMERFGYRDFLLASAHELRLEQAQPGGRLERAASMGSNMVTLRIGLSSVDEVDDEVETWLRRAHAVNA